MSKKMYYPTIGVECHVQFNTKTKLFAGVNNDAREASPNSLISPLCVGLPGTLPVLNEAVIPKAVKAGIALKANIANESHFDRKHYFYPDLPLGYQITQYEKPVITNGLVEVTLQDGSKIKVNIERAHLEADAGKSTHPAGLDYSLVDLNRAGTPLLEIVSGPDMHSAEQARAYAYELYLLMKYAGVSDVDLYHGNMRFDVNVSVSPDKNQLGTRTETKNLNSFKSIEKAIEYEIKRQSELLDKGITIVQETRGWDDAKQKTFSQRTKEDAHDYRYFPDPDIPPLVIEESYIKAIKADMPMMPEDLRIRFAQIGLDDSQIATIIDEPLCADVVRITDEEHGKDTARTVALWCVGQIQKHIINGEIVWSEVIAVINHLSTLASMLDESKLSSTAAKDLLLPIIKQNKSPLELAKELNLIQVSDESELVMIIEKVISENPQAANDVKNGEMKAIGFLVGQVMRQSKGKANPAVAQQLIKKQLGV
ncbi:MAG: Asp-tRNA(Asn)/Glu-tRNA(Gln) amidotransferase subunit GatB [Patescibacteria group bacterium]|jgi:aspartyl-tRNA(Asn)/glutamyl-tRNA(Gln) amidotransferase subunit B|nr:Asp-tRNA(Asn)/Glu-tRNA(Gln) amidotransferase subunit GatB [Patescibacteria group bacterium]